MKRILLFVFAILMFITSSVNVFAESDTDTSLDVTYSYNTETDRISINAAMVDIKPKEGIICVEYDIKYDPNVLELVKAESVFPERWDNYIKSGAIEDWSHEKGNGVYCWSFLIGTVGIGAKADGEIGINLEFKPIKKETTKVELLYLHVVTEEVENGFTLDVPEVSGSNATISINFDKPAEPDIEKSDISISEQTSSESVSSDVSSNEISYAPPITSGDTSGDNWPWDSDEMITMPSIDVEISAANSGEVNDSSANNLGEEDQNGWLIWTLIGVGVVAVVIATVVILKSKRGNQ